MVNLSLERGKCAKKKKKRGPKHFFCSCKFLNLSYFIKLRTQTISRKIAEL